METVPLRDGYGRRQRGITVAEMISAAGLDAQTCLHNFGTVAA